MKNVKGHPKAMKNMQPCLKYGPIKPIKPPKAKIKQKRTRALQQRILQ